MFFLGGRGIVVVGMGWRCEKSVVLCNCCLEKCYFCGLKLIV